ncbi:DUF4134 domain-containing protein [Pedobacter sp. ASV28]|uniref:DUF4134 domain-containing protein n=1 Tax=Pedobacter sp. ASV28 TaxID=2795123 RepID=UPI0018EB878A|nr:DUF4134 domain-containing protein [Pedobacter sp. ASV28]
MKFKHFLSKTTPVVFFFVLPFLASGQSPPGIGEFYSASREVSRWYFSLSDLVLVLGAISGMLGGLRVYSNWQSGKHHIDAQVMGWFFSCLFLSMLGAVLKALFGVH